MASSGSSAVDSTGSRSCELLSATTSMVDVAGERSISLGTTERSEFSVEPKSAGSTFGESSPRPAPSSPNLESLFFAKNYLLNYCFKINSVILRQLPKVR